MRSFIAHTTPVSSLPLSEGQGKSVIHITNGVTRHPERRMAEPVNLSISKGEQVAIVGPNGGGKSRLVDIIIGRYPLLGNEVKYDFSPAESRLVSDNLRYITFRDSYGDGDATYYYQQRWNQHDISDDAPTVGSVLSFEELPENVARLLSHLVLLRDKPIITLSSGEMRKLQLARVLASHPRVLIMDNPFIGLDAPTRDELSVLLAQLAETGLTLILVMSKCDNLPQFITHVIPVKDLKVGQKMTRDEFVAQQETPHSPTLPEEKRQWLLSLPEKDLRQTTFYPEQGGEILQFHDVSIRYGSRTILSHLNWTVCEGQRWAVSGRNGAGKSTLLSLVCADNPQAYACDIRLFGHKRGTGESIWEVKRHIGYVSPEMHRSYLKDIPAIDVVASGLNDSIGLYVRPQESQRAMCRQWMWMFGVEQLASRSFLTLSSGEQRLCLLARAFVKDPELLILDEPLHGLDDENRLRVKEIIETFCQRSHKTLIMVTHYAEELPPCIDNKLLLETNI